MRLRDNWGVAHQLGPVAVVDGLLGLHSRSARRHQLSQDGCHHPELVAPVQLRCDVRPLPAAAQALRQGAQPR